METIQQFDGTELLECNVEQLVDKSLQFVAPVIQSQVGLCKL